MSAGRAPAGPGPAPDAATGADPATERARLAGEGMVLAHWARHDPDRAAILSPNGDRTFGELNARANQAARAFRRLGLGAGDAVALLCGNRPEFAEVLAATQRGGFRLTPVNWHLTTDEVTYIVGDCEAKVLVSDRAHAEIAAAAARCLDDPPIIVVVGQPLEGTVSYDTLVAAEEPGDL